MSAIISIDDLEQSPECLTKSFRLVCADACLLTLHELKHKSGTELTVAGTKQKKFELIWNRSVTAEILNTWTEQNFTTDHAAVGLSFLLISKLSDYSVIQRSRKGTGFDYWMGRDKSNCKAGLPFDGAARLEISGIYRGKNADIRQRVQKKLEQTNQSDGMGIPAYVIVIEFSNLTSIFEKKA